MNRDSKRISNSSRGQIDNIKGYIRDAKRPFDGDGYPFKQALRELRKEGMLIKYIPEKCHYVKC
ncbi:hypothetical protein [Shewanella xiamenensis]|uniref:hypothetical protein n=1 Tax=Shewanella xiamenensis TaxID=332186 RepID=UPI0024A78CD8|nr:hypothetical protein [Shewanella xiamenensis]